MGYKGRALGATTKPATMVRSFVARATINQVSKAALLDLVVDMLRGDAGDEHLDGDALADAFLERFAPVAAARGGRAPKKIQHPRTVTKCPGCGRNRNELTVAQLREWLPWPAKSKRGGKKIIEACGFCVTAVNLVME